MYPSRRSPSDDQAHEERRPFFTPQTLAEYLAVSERTIYDLAARRKIPSYKVGGSRRFDPREIDEFLAQNRT